MGGERQEVDGRGETRGRWEGRDKRQMGGERQEVDGREDERQQEKLEKNLVGGVVVGLLLGNIWSRKIEWLIRLE